MKSDHLKSAVSNLKSKSAICSLKSAISLALLCAAATAIVAAQQQGTLTAAERVRLQRHRLAGEATVVEREDRDHRVLVDGGVSDGHRRTRAPGICGDERPGIRRRRGPRRSLLRAGQLVSGRRRADALHHLDLRRAEPGAPDVSARYVALRSDSRF